MYHFTEILAEPQNQYILEGTSAIITCIARGDIPYWTINGDTLTIVHRNTLLRYEAMGVLFINSTQSGTHNLTMIVPACLSTLVTNIQCTVTDNHGGNGAESGIVNITAFSTFSKYDGCNSNLPITH